MPSTRRHLLRDAHRSEQQEGRYHTIRETPTHRFVFGTAVFAVDATGIVHVCVPLALVPQAVRDVGANQLIYRVQQPCTRLLGYRTPLSANVPETDDGECCQMKTQVVFPPVYKVT